jgi:hypothetical protein
MKEMAGKAGKIGVRKNNVEHGGELLYSFPQNSSLPGSSAL